MRNISQTQPLIDAWFDFMPPLQQPIARVLQQTLHAALPAIEEQVRWGNLVFTLEGVPLLALASHKHYVALQVLLSVPLGQRFPKIETYGKGIKQIKNKPGVEVDTDMISALARTLALALRNGAGRARPRGGGRRF